MIFVFLWLTSLSMAISRSIHVTAYDGWVIYSIVYVYQVYLIHFSVSGHLGCFHVLPSFFSVFFFVLFCFFSKSHISYNFTHKYLEWICNGEGPFKYTKYHAVIVFNKINSSSELFWLDLFLNHLGHFSIDIALSFNMCLSNSSSMLWCSFTLGLGEPIIRHRIFSLIR